MTMCTGISNHEKADAGLSKRHKWTKGDIAEVKFLLAEGMSQYAVGVRFGVSTLAIKKLIYNIKYRKIREKVDKELVRGLRAAGASIDELCLKFNLGRRSVFYILRGDKPKWRSPKKPRGWVLGSGRGMSPLADPLIYALFQHHRELAPPELVKRLLPACLPRVIRVIRKLQPITITVAPGGVGTFAPRPLQMVLYEVLRKSGLSEDVLRSSSKIQSVVHARQEFYYLALAKTKNSASQVGKFIGRDHTTVYSGCDAYCQRTGTPMPRATKMNSIVRNERIKQKMRELRASRS